jgi:hypothetical protein
MAPFTRSQVSQSTRDAITKSVDEYNRRVYEEQKQEALEKKQKNEMEKAAETLLLLSRVSQKRVESVNHRPVTRSQR